MYGINWEDSDVAEHNYKVGDKVRVIKGWGDGCPQGSTGKISEVLHHGVCAKLDGGDGFAWFFNFNQIEPATIKAGDRVRLRAHTDTRACGDRGTVAEIDRKLALVKLDESGVWGENEWMSLNNLELTDDATVAEPAPEPKFKAGDVVRCIVDGFDDFTKGKTYIVEEGVDENGFVGIVADDDGDPNGLPPEAFELVSDTPHIVTVVKNGKPFPSLCPYVHASVADATAEAERLARANPGTEFAVYQRVAGRIAEQHIEMKEVA